MLSMIPSPLTGQPDCSPHLRLCSSLSLLSGERHKVSQQLAYAASKEQDWLLFKVYFILFLTTILSSPKFQFFIEISKKKLFAYVRLDL